MEKRQGLEELRRRLEVVEATVSIGSPISKRQVRLAVACLVVISIAAVAVAVFMPLLLGTGKAIYSLLSEPYPYDEGAGADFAP